MTEINTDTWSRALNEMQTVIDGLRKNGDLERLNGAILAYNAVSDMVLKPPTREQIIARFEKGKVPIWITHGRHASAVTLDRYYQRALVDGTLSLAELEVIVSVLKGEIDLS